MLKQLRPINLFIIVLTHYVIAYSFLQKFIAYSNRFHFDFFLLTFATISISAFGYLHNDFCDIDIDKINKPEKVIDIENTKIGIYISLTISALISIYLCFTFRNYSVIVFNTLVVLLLFYYNKYGKKQFLIGNLIVSLLCALVPAILYFYFREDFVFLKNEDGNKYFHNEYFSSHDMGFFTNGFIRLYITIAFLSTLIREIVKDMEDIEGDKMAGSKTIPILIGINWTKILLIIPYFSLLLFSSLLIILIDFKNNQLGKVNAIFGSYSLGSIITIPIIILGYFLIKAKQKSDFSRISVICKILMFIGLCIFLVF